MVPGVTRAHGEPGRRGRLRAAIETLLDDDALRARMGAAARAARPAAPGRKTFARFATSGTCAGERAREQAPGERPAQCSSCSPTTTTRCSAPARSPGRSRQGRRVRMLWATAGGLAPARRRLAEGRTVVRLLGLGPGATSACSASLTSTRPSTSRSSRTAALGLCATSDEVYVTAWEGGHPDHDALNLLGARLRARRQHDGATGALLRVRAVPARPRRPGGEDAVRARRAAPRARRAGAAPGADAHQRQPGPSLVTLAARRYPTGHLALRAGARGARRPGLDAAAGRRPLLYRATRAGTSRASGRPPGI